jgi:hypothetical protein
MKNNVMKRIMYMASILLLASVVLVSCKDDEVKPIDENPIFVEDGFYLSGTATGSDNLELDAMMMPGRVEGDGFASLLRNGMYEKFYYLSAGNLNVTQVNGATRTKWGWDSEGQKELALDGTQDQINGTVYHGTIAADGGEFNVETAGFYHIIIDESTSKAYFTRITHWAAIGDASDLGWSGEYKMDPVSVTAESASWKGSGIALRKTGGIKFRYNSGWKITGDDGVIIFANIGNENGEWVMGAGTFAHPEEEGEYDVTLNWTLANGFSFAYTRTGDIDPLPEYPDALFMIGDAVGGWSWDEIDLPMIPVHSNPHLFWKIVWLDNAGGFKFAPAKAWAGDFGKTGDATNGIFDRGGDNIPVPGESGYYMVVVNLAENKIAVVDPKVYLIGNNIENWDTANPNALFTVDNSNEVITITKDLVAPAQGNELRMYAWFDAADWFTKPLGDATQVSWWQVEFIILNGQIEYRGKGNDQARVPVETANYTINLNFKEETGTITKN